MSNFIKEQIKDPIMKSLKNDELFKNTHFTDDIHKLRSNVFNVHKEAMTMNIEETPNLKIANYCSDDKCTQKLVIGYHVPPLETVDEDHLNMVGLKVSQILFNDIRDGLLFDYVGISLEYLSMTIGRLHDRLVDDKSEIISNSVIIRYNIKFGLNEV